MTHNRRMVLSLFYHSTGHHVAGWRHPETPVGAESALASALKTVADAERNFYDLFFLADALYVPDFESDAVGRRYPPNVPFEPLTLLSALAVSSHNIGLAATVSTTYSNPYTVARMFSSLDHLSGGRAAWNIVTSHSDNEAHNHSADQHLGKEDRYRRADEFVQVAKALWDSWDADAFLPDKPSGLAFNPGKVHAIDFKGEYFSVRGPLISSHSPQGRPLFIQAGSSEPGLALAGKYAEAIFVAHQDITAAQDYYKTIRAHMAKSGRAHQTNHILPGISPIVGKTHEEALDKLKALQDLVDPRLGLQLLSHNLGGADLGGYELDAPLPDLESLPSMNSRASIILETARTENLTLRQLCQRVATSRGHFHVVGTGEHVANVMEEWFNSYACDGFNIMPPTMPDGFDDFNALVLPILRKRGLVQNAYREGTLSIKLDRDLETSYASQRGYHQDAIEG